LGLGAGNCQNDRYGRRCRSRDTPNLPERGRLGIKHLEILFLEAPRPSKKATGLPRKCL